VFLKKFNFFFVKNNIFYILNHFNVLILKIVLKNKKNIILIHFNTKNILKNNYKHLPKHTFMVIISFNLQLNYK